MWGFDNPAKCLNGFDAILTGRQSDQKLHRLYGNPIANNFFSQFVNQNIKALRKRLYSPSLKAVAWLEDAPLIVLIPYICLYFFPANRRLDVRLTSQILQTNV